MAKLTQGILGGISGKIGNVVGSSWKGISVIKSKPLSVANPESAAQVAQRTKMSNVVAVAKVINASVIKPFWDRFASKMSGYNAFVQTNIALFENNVPSPASSFVISNGKMGETAIAVLNVEVSGKEVQVQWDDDSGMGYKLATDTVALVAINMNTGEVVADGNAGQRSFEGATVFFNGTVTAGDLVYAYLAFKRADGTIVSQTSNMAATAA